MDCLLEERLIDPLLYLGSPDSDAPDVVKVGLLLAFTELFDAFVVLFALLVYALLLLLFFLVFERFVELEVVEASAFQFVEFGPILIQILRVIVATMNGISVVLQFL